MSKPTLFIGSSVERLDLARAVQSSLEYDAFPIVWTEGFFQPSQFALESLEDALERADFAVFICTPDDVTKARGQEYPAIRDNVIFELGLFMGRLGRKRTFLIGPRGGSPPLPSDLNGLSPETYDATQDAMPEAAVGPACNKIRLAMRRSGSLPRQTQDLQEAKAFGGEMQEQLTDPALPLPTWTRSDFEWGVFFAILRDDDTTVSKIDAAFRASAMGSTPQSIAEWEAWHEVAKMRARKRGSVPLVREKSDAFPNSAVLKEYLGRGLSHYGDELGAAAAFSEAVRLSQDMKTVSRVARRVLESEKDVGGSNSAMALRELILTIPQQSHDDTVSFASAMQAIAEAANATALAKAISEAALTISPEDISARFELARRYADENQNNLSMLHYETIPIAERTGIVWNNLGVNYARLRISGKAIEAYEMASRLGETISEGNLAQKLVSAGFYEEAQSRTEKAIGVENHHESLVGVLNLIKETRDAEAVAHDAAFTKAREQQSFRSTLGQAALEAAGPEIVGTWLTTYGVIEFSRDQRGLYVGFGEITREVRGGGLAALFAPSATRLENSKVVVELLRFGNALEGTATIEGSSDSMTILGSLNLERKLLLRIAEDGSKLMGLEINYDEEPICWERQQGLLIEGEK